MRLYTNSNRRQSFQLEKTDFCDANGSKTIEFSIFVESNGFSGSLSKVWFYREDLVGFADAIEDLTSGKVNSVSLSAMTDFVLGIYTVDTSGHFAAKFSLTNATDGNDANLTVFIETQLLSEFITELRSL